MSVTKTLTKAVPTINLEDKVVKWDIEIKYEKNGYESNFSKMLEFDGTKSPSDFTKAELFEAAGEEHLDAVFDSQYESVMNAPAPTESKVDDFDVDSLA